MAWDFETDPDFQAKLDWAEIFVRDEVEPLDHRLDSIYDVKNPENVRLVRPLQAEVKARGLWACHLGPELGGPGFGQVKLALLNEILGRSHFAPVVFGWVVAGHQLGAACAAYGAGVLREILGNYTVDYLIAGAFCVIASLMVTGIGRRKAPLAAVPA